MLAQANRIRIGSDYKAIVRHGLRVVGPHMVTYLRKSRAVQKSTDFQNSTEAVSVRFGFIVAKSVGGAVARNRVRRRLKAASYELLPSVRPGTDVVIRALPASVEAQWETVMAELSDALNQGGAL